MTDSPAGEAYQESCDFSWTERAFQMLIAGELHGELTVRDAVLTSRVWGPCPRCQDHLDDRQTHTAITNIRAARDHSARAVTTRGPVADEPVFAPVDVTCACTTTHAGAPPRRRGCGTSFRVELPLPTTGEDLA
jgi:hypothetical protein